MKLCVEQWPWPNGFHMSWTDLLHIFSRHAPALQLCIDQERSIMVSCSPSIGFAGALPLVQIVSLTLHDMSFPCIHPRLTEH